MGIPLESSQGAIPAYAGSTEREKRGGDLIEAHPRLRGEHSLKPVLSSLTEGSSPLTRGTRPGSTPSVHTNRLIHAYAGNTVALPSR